MRGKVDDLEHRGKSIDIQLVFSLFRICHVALGLQFGLSNITDDVPRSLMEDCPEAQARTR